MGLISFLYRYILLTKTPSCSFSHTPFLGPQKNQASRDRRRGPLTLVPKEACFLRMLPKEACFLRKLAGAGAAEGRDRTLTRPRPSGAWRALQMGARARGKVGGGGMRGLDTGESGFYEAFNHHFRVAQVSPSHRAYQSVTSSSLHPSSLESRCSSLGSRWSRGGASTPRRVSSPSLSPPAHLG
jgi:hypothetical protein